MLPKINGIGRLTKDIELSYVGQNNTGLATFGMAFGKKSNGKEETCFIDCKAWGKLAETINNYCAKGLRLSVNGELKQETWQDKTTGANRSKHTLNIEQIELIDFKDKQQAPEPKQQYQPPFKDEPKPQAKQHGKNEDEIPF